MLIINLVGSYMATCRGLVVDLHKSKRPKDPIGPLARLLIEQGLDRDLPVRVVRSGHPVFRDNHTLGYWADHDWSDTQDDIPRRRKYSPFEKAFKDERLVSSGT